MDRTARIKSSNGRKRKRDLVETAKQLQGMESKKRKVEQIINL